VIAYLRLEVVRQLRKRDALLFRIVLPAALYIFFKGVVFTDSTETSEGLPTDTTSMVVFAVLGTLATALFATGPALAEERAIGWLRQLHVTPVPASAAVAGKVAAAMTFALPSVTLVALTGAFVLGVDLPLGRWIALVLLLWLTAPAFAALGVLIGISLRNPETAQSATSLSLILLHVLGGLYTTPGDLPGALEALARALPSNVAAELGFAAARGEAPALSALVVIIAWAGALTAAAALAWHRLSAVR
jgi:ABC-2 type transport system permease protein